MQPSFGLYVITICFTLRSENFGLEIIRIFAEKFELKNEISE